MRRGGDPVLLVSNGFGGPPRRGGDDFAMGDDFETGRRWHDMGGDLERLRALRGDEAVLLDDHDHALWEKRIDALLVLLTSKGVFSVDGLRRALEDMGEEAFETLGYYERWTQAVAQNLVDAGVLSIEELRERTEAVRARGASYGRAAAPADASGERSDG